MSDGDAGLGNSWEIREQMWQRRVLADLSRRSWSVLQGFLIAEATVMTSARNYFSVPFWTANF